MEEMTRQATIEKLSIRLERYLEEWVRIPIRPNPASIKFKQIQKAKIITIAEQLVLLNLFADGRKEVTSEERIQTLKDYLNARLPQSKPFITYEQLKERDYLLRGIKD